MRLLVSRQREEGLKGQQQQAAHVYIQHLLILLVSRKKYKKEQDKGHNQNCAALREFFKRGEL